MSVHIHIEDDGTITARHNSGRELWSVDASTRASGDLVSVVVASHIGDWAECYLAEEKEYELHVGKENQSRGEYVTGKELLEELDDDGGRGW